MPSIARLLSIILFSGFLTNLYPLGNEAFLLLIFKNYYLYYTYYIIHSSRLIRSVRDETGLHPCSWTEKVKMIRQVIPGSGSLAPVARS